MAVISSKLVGTYSDVNEKGQFTHFAQYRVICDDRQMTGMSVLFGGASATPDPIPSWKSTFALFGDVDLNAFALKFKPRYQNPEGSNRIWLVDVEYGPDENPDDDWTNDQDPLLRPVRIDGDEEEVQEICEQGWNEEALTGLGRAADTFGPIENAAGKEPGTPLIKAVRVPVLVFRKNFKDGGTSALAQIMTLAATYVDKLNNATFYGAAAGKAIVRSIRPSEEMIAGGVKYREATIRVAAYNKGWSFPMVNRGYEYLYNTGTEGSPVWELRMARKPDENGKLQLVSEPVNLTLGGTISADGTLGTVINWRTSDKVDFAGLGVGTS